MDRTLGVAVKNNLFVARIFFSSSTHPKASDTVPAHRCASSAKTTSKVKMFGAGPEIAEVHKGEKVISKIASTFDPEDTTPIEPIIEALLAKISSAEHANQYPPDAATSSTKAITGILFFSDKLLMRLAIISDWTGDPPGEFICNATAFKFFAEKASSMFLSISFKFNPFLLPILGAIIPLSGITETF